MLDGPGHDDEIDPGILARLGHLVVVWARVEWFMEHLMLWLSDARVTAMTAILPTVSAATISGWARQIVQHVASLDDGDRAIILPILDEFDDLRSQRNALVHGTWQPFGEGAALVYSARLDRAEIIKHHLVTLHDLDYFIECATELELELFTLSEFYEFTEAINRDRPELRRPA